jgi:hypothetical protein
LTVVDPAPINSILIQSRPYLRTLVFFDSGHHHIRVRLRPKCLILLGIGDLACLA